MVVFGDSYADAGRKFDAPASHQFEKYGIGPFPWKRLYAAPNSDVSALASVQTLLVPATTVGELPPVGRKKNGPRGR